MYLVWFLNFISEIHLKEDEENCAEEISKKSKELN